jgi:hypothetical protein
VVDVCCVKFNYCYLSWPVDVNWVRAYIIAHKWVMLTVKTGLPISDLNPRIDILGSAKFLDLVGIDY